MATPDMQRNSVEVGGVPTEVHINSRSTTIVSGPPTRDRYFWLTRAFYLIGVLAGVGFVVILLGAYAIPVMFANLDGVNMVLAGTIIVILAVVGWIVSGAILIVMTLTDVARILRSRRTQRQRNKPI